MTERTSSFTRVQLVFISDNDSLGGGEERVTLERPQVHGIERSVPPTLDALLVKCHAMLRGKNEWVKA